MRRAARGDDRWRRFNGPHTLTVRVELIHNPLAGRREVELKITRTARRRDERLEASVLPKMIDAPWRAIGRNAEVVYVAAKGILDLNGVRRQNANLRADVIQVGKWRRRMADEMNGMHGAF